MGIKTQNGFTFIEVMLFLAVTGLLAMAILAGSGMAINQQRYRDSVNTLKSYIQQQYSEVTSVINSRDENWECNSNGLVTDTGGPAGEARGRSDCVLLGRFITVNETGKQLTASGVSAYRLPGAISASSDLQEITTNYRLAISPIDQEQDEVSWGAQIVKQKTTAPMPLSILIIRSPLSGSIMTFTTEGVQTNLNAMVTSGNMSVVRNMCVNADATSFLGVRRLEVRLEAFASGQSAVSIPPESASVCD
jgi:type II secretory pathway pseudopilin PulG